jgi:hypothetical protein
MIMNKKILRALTESWQWVKSNETVLELLRGVRAHFTRFIKALKPGDAQQAMLGLGHSYSRSKVKFNVHRVDNMIIQSSALLDQLDKDLNVSHLPYAISSPNACKRAVDLALKSLFTHCSFVIACLMYVSCVYRPSPCACVNGTRGTFLSCRRL